MKEKEWVVIYWEYGYHRDQFEITKAVGPVTFERAEELSTDAEEAGFYLPHLAIIEEDK